MTESLNTCRVVGTLLNPNGTPSYPATIIFTLRRRDYDGPNVILPEPVSADTDVEGHFEIDLWPNSEGRAGTVYWTHVEVGAEIWNRTKYATFVTVVPDVTTARLVDISDLVAPTSIDDVRAAVLLAQDAAAHALERADSAAADAATATAAAEHVEAAVDSIAAFLNDIAAVADIKTQVQSIAQIASQVQTTASLSAQIQMLSDINYATAIVTVSANIVSVTNVSANMADVLAAPSYAAAAAKWAEGTLPGGAGTKSSKEWSNVSSGYAAQSEASFEGASGIAGTLATALATLTNREIYVKRSGNDLTGTGTGALPYRTVGKALSVAASILAISPGVTVTIRTQPNFKVTEEINNTLEGIVFEHYKGAPAVYDAFDDYAPTWTLFGASYTYSATFNLQWTDAGTGSLSGAQRLNPAYMQKVSGAWKMLREVRVIGAGETANGTWLQANDAACKAFVEANEGWFYLVGAGGGNYYSGWQKGNATLYLHAYGNGNPTASSFRALVRRAPRFGSRCEARNFKVVGTLHRDGMSMTEGALSDYSILYPQGHGQLVSGCTIWRGKVKHGNRSQIAVNAFENFQSTANFAQRGELNDCEVEDWLMTGGLAVYSHGDSAGTPSLGVFAINNMKLTDVWSPGGGAEVRDGVIWNNLQARRLRNGFVASNACHTWLLNCDIQIKDAASSASANDAMFSLNASYGYFVRNSRLACRSALMRGVTMTGGGLDIASSHVICGNTTAGSGDFGTMTTSAGGGGFLRLTDSTLRAYAGNPDRPGSTSGGIGSLITVAVTRSIWSDLQWPAQTTFDEHSFGCPPGTAEGIASAIDFLPDNAAIRLGERVLKIVAQGASGSDQGVRETFMATTLSLYRFNQGDTTLKEFDWPSGFVPRGACYVGNSANKRFVAYGLAGALYKWTNGAVSPTAVTTGRTTNWISAVSKEDNTVLLLGDAGEVTLYDASTDTFTDLASGITYPLQDGVYNGTDYYLVGCNAARSAGGVVKVSGDHSTLTAYTPGTVFSAITVVQGVLLIGGYNNTFQTSVNSGVSWAALAGARHDIWCRGFITDTARNRTIAYGPAKSDNGVGFAAMLITAPSGTPSTWTAEAIDVPGGAIVAGAFNPYYLNVSGFAPSFWVSGPAASPYFSEDTRGWKRIVLPRSRVAVPDIDGDPDITQMIALAG